MQQAKLHIIPNTLADNATHTLPVYLAELIFNINIYFVEELKAARQLLKKINKQIDINACTFYLLNEHSTQDVKQALAHWKNNAHIGLISESGCPCIADPGKELIEIAHKNNVQVVPHVGPNSILLALMASGFNGQQFHFHGYLPIKKPELATKIKNIEADSMHTQSTHIFIEAPYRNNQLLAELCTHCKPHTLLCIASNLTAQNERIITMPIKDWKNNHFDFHKIPSVFLLYST